MEENQERRRHSGHGSTALLQTIAGFVGAGVIGTGEEDTANVFETAGEILDKIDAFFHRFFIP